MRLADSALPIGAFAYSFGLETYIQEGIVRDGRTLRELLKAELRLRVSGSDLSLLRRIYDAALREDVEAIIELDRTVHALKHARENRAASLQMGRALLDLSVRVTPTPFLQVLHRRFLDRSNADEGHLLTAQGAVAAARGLSIEETAAAYLYGFLSSRISVAVRLIPLGHTEGQKVLVSLFAECGELISAIKNEEEDLSDFSGIDDIQMMRHEQLETRTFRS